MAKRNIIICDICAMELEASTGTDEFRTISYKKTENNFGDLRERTVYFDDVCFECRSKLSRVIEKKIAELKEGK